MAVFSEWNIKYFCYIISELRSFVKYDIRKIVRKYLVILFLEKCRKCLIIFVFKLIDF